MAVLDAEIQVGTLVRQQPSRSRIFEQYKIDYCCGGKLSLAEACGRKGIDPQAVIDQLHAVETEQESNDAPNPDDMSLTQLADHIEQTHHTYLRRELPRLSMMAQKVADVHGDHQPWTKDLNEVLGSLVEELQSHMLKEEQVLFPMIRTLEAGDQHDSPGCGMSVTHPIGAMEHEHDMAGEALEKLRALSSGFTPPEDACNTFRALLDGLRELELDLHQHIHKENNVLFPKAAAIEHASQ